MEKPRGKRAHQGDPGSPASVTAKDSNPGSQKAEKAGACEDVTSSAGRKEGIFPLAGNTRRSC